jgi:uncharacterized protein (AIM24 family)
LWRLAVGRTDQHIQTLLQLERGQTLDVREHQFLLATSNIEYSFFFQRGLANLFFSRSGGLFIDRFIGQQQGGLLLIHGYGNVFEKYLAPGKYSM